MYSLKTSKLSPLISPCAAHVALTASLTNSVEWILIGGNSDLGAFASLNDFSPCWWQAGWPADKGVICKLSAFHFVPTKAAPTPGD